MNRARAFLLWLLVLLPTLGWADWKPFFDKSETFRTWWEKASTVHRSGKETEWDSITQNAELLAESYEHLVARDGWFQERAPFVSEETWSRLEALADQIESNPVDRDLLYLMIYLRDLGWAETGCGQFHQLASVPIVEEVMRELGYPQEAIEECMYWTKNHSMPAEFYLGEASPRSARELVERLGDKMPMVAMLSLLELNCIRPDLSAVQEANAQVIASLGEGVVPEVDRIVGLTRSRLLHAKSSPELRAEVESKSVDRLIAFNLWLYEECSVYDIGLLGRFMEEVDLHYVAGSFPQMAPEAIGLFLLRSAWAAAPDLFGEVLYHHVINMNQFSAADLAEGPIAIDEERQWVVWRAPW